MKKWYLLAALAALSACSDKAEKQGSVHYAFTPKDSSFSKHIDALLHPCPGDAFCQTVLLREGTKIPDYPLRSIDDLVGIYAYDKGRFKPMEIAWNCSWLPADEATARGKDCLTVERANELLAPYVK